MVKHITINRRISGLTPTTLAANARDDDRNQGQTSTAGTNPSMLGSFTDLDVLDCPICCEALSDRVFQCENGHVACSSCCIKIGNKCPSCSLPIGHIRCRSIERILNSIKFPCKNLEYGCKETMLHRKREVHEKACVFGPRYCPLEGCHFVGSSENLYAHFRGRHLGNATQFDYKRPFRFRLESSSKLAIFQEKTDGTIFILNQRNNCNKHVTRAINLVCMGPFYLKDEFCCELSVISGGNAVKLKSKWSASHRFGNCYLWVPTVGCLDVEVCIDKS